MTIVLIAALSVFVIVAVILFFLSKSKGNESKPARYYRTEDLAANSIKKSDDTPRLNADTSGKRDNGTAVLTPEMESSTGTGNNEPGRANNAKVNNGTAVLRPEDDPFSDTGKKQDDKQHKPARRGTEVLKSDDSTADNDIRDKQASADPAASKAPPTELLEDLPVEEPGGGLFSKHVYKKACLQRTRTKDRIELKTDQFIIGREPGLVDLCLEDNLSVSRHHATIRKKGSDYYIVDNDSLNYTFVNNLKLKPQSEVKLKNRDKIMIGDEAFTFILK